MPERAERPVRSFHLAYWREVKQLACDPLVLVPSEASGDLRMALGPLPLVSRWSQGTGW
jgi:hypothetical protein